MNIRLWLTFGVVSVVFLITLVFGVNTFASYQSSLLSTHTSTLTPIPTSIPTQPLTPKPVIVELKGVDHYYAALIRQDYQDAYSSFDSAGMIHQQKVSPDKLKELDQQKSGAIGGVTLYVFESVTFSDTTASVVVSVQRGNPPAPPYQVHLTLKQKDQHWRIIDVDDI